MTTDWIVERLVCGGECRIRLADIATIEPHGSMLSVVMIDGDVLELVNDGASERINAAQRGASDATREGCLIAPRGGRDVGPPSVQSLVETNAAGVPQPVAEVRRFVLCRSSVRPHGSRVFVQPGFSPRRARRCLFIITEFSCHWPLGTNQIP